MRQCNPHLRRVLHRRQTGAARGARGLRIVLRLQQLPRAVHLQHWEAAAAADAGCAGWSDGREIMRGNNVAIEIRFFTFLGNMVNKYRLILDQKFDCFLSV